MADFKKGQNGQNKDMSNKSEERGHNGSQKSMPSGKDASKKEGSRYFPQQKESQESMKKTSANDCTGKCNCNCTSCGDCNCK